jgi:hypothetical protein
VSEAATAFGTSSEEFLAFRQRFVEIRTEFDKANLAEQLRVIDAQAQLFGATFEKLPAQIDATKSAILDLLHEGLEPTDPAIQALTTRLRELQLIQDTVGTVFDSLNQTLTTSVKGVLLGTQTIGDAFKNLGQNIAVSLVESAVKRMLKTIENYLIDFLESEAFKKFLLFLLNLGVSATGSASGSTPGFSPSPTTTGFASGGIVQHQPGGRLVLAGEGGQDEAIIPLPALAHFGGGSNVEVNVITPPGSRVEQRERSGPDGKQIRDIVITMVGDALGNGTFDPVMKGSYGAVRKGISR